ncbi:hypothetical protein [Thermomonas sp.]|uniref:hypothetical protein n=1 Tax=Thermomonas sp. TaxID=1971895 RepID=UPI003D0C6FE4
MSRMCRLSALSPRHKRRKDKRRPGLPMLKDDGHMLDDGLPYPVPPGAGVLYLGTSVRYGAAQHFGYGASCPATGWACPRRTTPSW